MADPVYREIVIIINGDGLSRGLNVRAWKEWADDLPVKLLSLGLSELPSFHEHLDQEYTHAWVVDANYLPYANAFRPAMRKQLSRETTCTIFSVKKPLAARHFYEDKWTTDSDVHDKFGGVRFIKLGKPDAEDKLDEIYLGRPADFVHFATSRLGFPYCVFQLSSEEPEFVTALNFDSITDVYAGAVQIRSSGSILESHVELARRSDTEIFLVFDADFKLDTALLNDEFQPWEKDSVHLWYARNPINGLEYGHGGPKAFNREAFSKLEGPTLDVTTSASSSRMLVHKQCVGTHAFNWSSLSTWRTAFREAAKLTLALNTIADRIEYDETYQRREAWTAECDSSKPFATECVHGARAGKLWAERVNNRVQAVQINDFAWLESEYTERFGEKE